MVGAGVVYLLFRDRSSSSASAPLPLLPTTDTIAPRRSSSGACVPAVQTGGKDPALWIATRWAAAADDFVRRGVPQRAAENGARGIVAQWAVETNNGRSEYCFNLGGWKAAAGEACFELPQGQTRELVRWAAFPSLQASVHEHIERLATRARFQRAFAAFVNNPTSEAWIFELGRSGYFGEDPAAYARAWRSRLSQIEELTRAAA